MDSVVNTLTALRANPYTSATINLFLVLYAGLAAPSLPASIASLFENGLFKLAILVAVSVLVQNNNLTTGILVAVGFVLSMNTLSRYRVFTMANELSNITSSSESEEEPMKNLGLGSTIKRDWHPSFGPDGQRQKNPSNVATWGSSKGVNKVQLRGYEYSGHDELNHLPGGHGDIDQNDTVVAAPLHPDKRFSGPQGVKGYQGNSFATIGAPDSQLWVNFRLGQYI